MAARLPLSNAPQPVTSSPAAMMHIVDVRRPGRRCVPAVAWRPAPSRDLRAGTPPCGGQRVMPVARAHRDPSAAMRGHGMPSARPRRRGDGVELAGCGRRVGVEVDTARLGRAAHHRTCFVAKVIRHRGRGAKVLGAVAGLTQRRSAKQEDDAQPKGRPPEATTACPRNTAHQTLYRKNGKKGSETACRSTAQPSGGAPASRRTSCDPSGTDLWCGYTSRAHAYGR